METRNAGRLKRWDNLVDPGQSENKVMQRHENFLSNTEKVTATYSTTCFSLQCNCSSGSRLSSVPA